MTLHLIPFIKHQKNNRIKAVNNCNAFITKLKDNIKSMEKSLTIFDEHSTTIQHDLQCYIHETLYVFTMFKAKYSNTLLEIIFMLDATSSVAQHLAALLRKFNLGKLSNFVSDKQEDLYRFVSDTYGTQYHRKIQCFLVSNFQLFI